MKKITHDFIQNNQKQIDLLEEKAKLIYNKSLSNQTEKLNFDDVIDIIEGPGIGRNQHRQNGIRISNIRLFNNDEFNFKTANFIDALEVENKYKKYLLKENDILVVAATTVLGKSVLVRSNHLPLLLNVHLYRLTPKEPLNTWYLKAYITHGDFKKKLNSIRSGSTSIWQTQIDSIKSLNIKLPNLNTLCDIEEQFSEIYSKKKALLDENHKIMHADS
jgi:restriction endonuclease S subunit